LDSNAKCKTPARPGVFLCCHFYGTKRLKISSIKRVLISTFVGETKVVD